MICAAREKGAQVNDIKGKSERSAPQLLNLALNREKIELIVVFHSTFLPVCCMKLQTFLLPEVKLCVIGFQDWK